MSEDRRIPFSPASREARPGRPHPLLTLLVLPLAACVVAIGGRGHDDDHARMEDRAGRHHAAVAQCEVRGERRAEVDAAGAAALELSAGAGSLEVRGSPDLDHVRIRGDACASDADLLEEIRIETRRDGDRVVVEARMPDTGGGDHAEMDLVVEAPASLRAEVDDGSGPITVRDLAGLSLHDGSGSIDVARIDGPVRIDDGSGSLQLSEIRGTVDVEDGSGSLSVESVKGDVSVEDGSGELTIRRIRGSVRVDDGSGDIRVADVTGDLLVEESGSGGLAVDRVAGQVRIED